MTRQFHLLDLRNKDFPYAKGWIDVSEKILLANFKLLTEFVEKEEPFRFHYRKDGKVPARTRDQDDADYENLKRSRQVGREIWELYVWWTKTRKAEHARHAKVLMTIYKGSKKSKKQLLPIGEPRKWAAYHSSDDRLLEKDQQMLHRLVDIRECLWT